MFSPCVDTESNVDLSIMFFVCKKLTMFAYLYSYKWWGQSHLSHQISPVFSLLNFVNGLMVKLCVSTDCTTASIKKILIFLCLFCFAYSFCLVFCFSFKFSFHCGEGGYKDEGQMQGDWEIRWIGRQDVTSKTNQ